MPIRSLTSKSNRLIKKIRLVAQQARKAPVDLLLAEGIRALEEAVGAGLEIEAVLISDRYGSTDREQSLLESLLRASSNTCRVPDPVFSHLSGVQAPQGILALVRVQVLQLADMSLPDRPLVLCACGIQDPGNLGTLIRSAAAAGTALVCSLAGTVSARNPKAIRASAGALFRMPVVEQVSAQEFLEFCRRHSLPLLRSSARTGICYFNADLAQPCAILLGNEGSGLDESAWAGVPGVRIPMTPGVESLNVAAAGAILLFEARRQRSLGRSDA